MVNERDLCDELAYDLLVCPCIDTRRDLVSDLEGARYCVPDFARLTHGCYAHLMVYWVVEPVWLNDWWVGDAVRTYCHVTSRNCLE